MDSEVNLFLGVNSFCLGTKKISAHLHIAKKGTQLLSADLYKTYHPSMIPPSDFYPGVCDGSITWQILKPCSKNSGF